MKQLDHEKFYENKYNHFLIALILLFIFSPSLEVRELNVHFPVIPLIVLIVLVTAIRTNFSKGAYLTGFMTFSFINFVLLLLIYFLSDSYVGVIKSLKIITDSISVIFYLITFYILSKRLFLVQKVTADTIKGGVCAYLLLGFIWAILYGLLVKIDPNAFLMTSQKEMMYVHFSFTTLTTLGYGDIIPNNRIAAVLTNAEAIIGQIYLTIFVARLVGLYISSELSVRQETHK